MASTTTNWLEEAHEVKKKALKRKSKEVFIQPIFKGKTLILEYRNLKLQVKDLDPEIITILRKSGVPRHLNNAEYKDWGGEVPKSLLIHGKIVRSRKDDVTRRFIATSVSGPKGKEYHNQITSMHLLFARGFYTPLAQSSWMATKDVQPKTLKKRLAVKLTIRVENRAGKAFSAREPIGLQLFDCMGWKKSRKEID
jgi:hypothetical protein